MTPLRLLLVSLSWLLTYIYAQSPIANFTANPLTVCVGQNVNFTNTSSANGGAALSSYQWDFGDGNAATTTNASHAFSTAGTFTITLVATNASGVADAEIKPAYITVNPLPNVGFSANGLGCTVPLTPFLYQYLFSRCQFFAGLEFWQRPNLKSIYTSKYYIYCTRYFSSCFERHQYQYRLRK